MRVRKEVYVKPSFDKVTYEKTDEGYKVYDDGVFVGTVRKEPVTRRRKDGKWGDPIVKYNRWVGADPQGKDTPGEIRTRKKAVLILLERHTGVSHL